MTDKEMTNAEKIKLPVRRMDGSETGEQVELDPKLFGLEKNDHVLYLAVKAEMTNKRQGTHSTKGRTEVRGGGRKPWRQKGRGTARVGTIRSPIWRGGGITFGPKPHDYSMKLPKKIRRLARRIAYSVKAQQNAIEFVDEFKVDEPKTKKIAKMLESFELKNKSVLILDKESNANLLKSCRNIPRVEVRECLNASTVDILRARRILISRSALDILQGGLIDG